MYKAIFTLLIILISSQSYAKEVVFPKGNKDKEKISKHFGFAKLKPLSTLKTVYDKDGKEGLKKTLFYIDEFSHHYKVTQKLEKVFIYSIPNEFTPFVSLQMIPVKPIKGEFTLKGSFIPGKYYKVIDLLKLTKPDGFEITLPLIERVTGKSKLIGFGTPPPDSECRKLIIGIWSDGLYIHRSLGKETIKLKIFKPNGIFEFINYTKYTSSGDWSKELSIGTWDIDDSFISTKYKIQETWGKKREDKDWNKNIVSISGQYSGGAKIIKLTENNLITVRTSEKDFIRLKSTELNNVLSEFDLD